MITYNNNKETINVTFRNIIVGNNVNNFRRKNYELELPKITCDNEETAIFIQRKINDYVSDLINNIMS